MAKFCNMCGNKLDENATKCPGCGKIINPVNQDATAVSDKADEKTDQTTEKGQIASFFKKNVVIISLVTFIVVGLIIMGLPKIDFSVKRPTIQDAQTAIEASFKYIVNVPENKLSLTSIAKSGTEIVVVKIVEEEDKFYAECDVTTYDFNGVMMDYAKENGAKEITKDTFLSEVEAKLQESEKITTRTQILLEENSDGETEAKFTEEQLDMLLGGYLTFAQEYVDMLKGQQVD